MLFLYVGLLFAGLYLTTDIWGMAFSREGRNHLIKATVGQKLFNRLTHSPDATSEDQKRQENIAFYTLVALFLGTLMSSMSFSPVPLAVSIFLCTLPFVFLKLKSKDAAVQKIKGLSQVIDAIGLAMGAGLPFFDAVAEVQRLSPKTPLSKELGVLLAEMEMGTSKELALKHLSQRIQHPSMERFTHAVTESLSLGTNLVERLEDQASQLSSDHFAKAEELAGKSSVKMMFPMMMFVMPASILVVLGPIFFAGYMQP